MTSAAFSNFDLKLPELDAAASPPGLADSAPPPSICIWLAKSFDAMSPSSKYQNTTQLSLICVRNDTCVFKTAPSCKRLSDAARGCSVLAEAHKKLDKVMKFLTCCLYSLVLEQTGENWIDKALGGTATIWKSQ